MTFARHVGEALWSPEANRRYRVLGSGATVALRAGGQWAALVTHPSAAGASVTAANLLSTELARVYSTSAPARVSSASADGIRCGLAAEWGLTLPDGTDWYIGATNGRGYVVGSTLRALQWAVRRVLHLLGYARLSTVREVFPTLTAALALPSEQRALPHRFIQNVGATLVNPDQGQARLTSWTDQNVPPAIGLVSSGHSWAAIIQANLATFTAHPEYTGGGLLDATAKFACYTPAVITIALTYTQGQFAGGGRWGSSLSASDSGGWTLSVGSGEQATKSPTDRVLHLANAVQPSLSTDQHVVLLAYAETSLAPVSETVDPRILIMPTTSFVQGGGTWETVRARYLAAGASLFAIYDYPNEWIWSNVQDRPGGAAASTRPWVVTAAARLALVTGANQEDYASWAVTGRARWALAGAYTGDDAAARWDAYPAKLFPSALVQAVAWFSVLETPAPFSTDQVRGLILAAQGLIAATAGSTVVGEHESALDCARYAIYCHLMRAWLAAQTATTFEALLRWCWRDRHRDLWCFLAAYRAGPWATPRKSVAALHSLSDLTEFSGATLWGDAQTTEAELVAALATALPLNPAIPFAVVGYSSDYVRVTGLTSPRPRGNFGVSTQINTTPQFWLQGSGVVHINFNGGVVRTDLGPDHVTIYDRASQTVILDVDISETGPDQAYDLTLDPALVYLLDVVSKGGVAITVPTGTGFSYIEDPNRADFQAGTNAYVYVPRGTTTFGFFAHAGTIRVRDHLGTVLLGPQVASDSYLQVAVPTGADGAVFEVNGVTGAWSPLTTPPGAALAPGELFVPRSVAEADGLSYIG